MDVRLDVNVAVNSILKVGRLCYDFMSHPLVALQYCSVYIGMGLWVIKHMELYVHVYIYLYELLAAFHFAEQS